MKNAPEDKPLRRPNGLLRTCRTCLFHDRLAEEGRDHCFRFARFVDHRLHDASRDCDYWSPAPSPS